jgi:arylsulfatase A-like enzyme
MGCAGNPDVETPNMDRLAADGMRFTSAYANEPVCTPSRGCILTGQYSCGHGAALNEMRIHESSPSIAHSLNEVGYLSGYVGKWHLDGTPHDRWTPPGPRRMGFDDHWAINQSAHDYLDAQYYADSETPIDMSGYTPANETDQAIDFIDRAGADPFCLFLSWGPPHMPYGDVPATYRERYDPGDLTLRPNVEPTRGPIPDNHAVDSCPPDASQERQLREVLRNYYAHVTALDEQLGRLLDHLDRQGLREDTIVVYTADHGDMLWSHGLFEKCLPHEESAGIPLVIDWPAGLPSGTVSESLVSTVDLAPTLLGLTGETPPSAMHGTDLSPVLQEDAVAPESVYLRGPAIDHSEWRGVRTETYTYAELVDGTPWVLFDDGEDPYQRTNRAFDPDYADVRADLSEELTAWESRYDHAGATSLELATEHGTLDEVIDFLQWYGKIE